MTWYSLGAGSALVFQRASKEFTLVSRERKLLYIKKRYMDLNELFSPHDRARVILNKCLKKFVAVVDCSTTVTTRVD